MNVRGLGNKEKRKAIFKYCRKRAEVIFLQETHGDDNSILEWEKEWRGKTCFNNADSKSRGVAILVREGTQIEICNIHNDTSGRFIIADLKTEEKSVSVCNIYGPNTDKPEFFREVAVALESREENKIIMGDFNVALDSTKDRLGSSVYHKKSASTILEVMTEYSLTEVWRDRNLNKEQYSWEKRIRSRLEQASRIDYMLVSRGLDSDVENITYIEAVKTDHLALFASVKMSKNERGSGYWKLNCKLLQDDKYVELITETIRNTIKEYKSAHPITAWEKLKLEIKNKTIDYSKEK